MFTDETYLCCILNAILAGQNDLVRTNYIAQALNYKASSVTIMLQKLHLKKMLIYNKNQGVRLTDLGKLRALLFMRGQMLWNVFFTKELMIPNLNKSNKSIDFFFHPNTICALDNFLENPLYDLKGNAIPTAHGSLEHKFGLSLSVAEVNIDLNVVAFKKCTPEINAYMNKKGINFQTRIKILEKCELDNSIDIKLDDSEKVVTISKNIADLVLVKY